MSDQKPVRHCPVCEHPSVLAINQAILNGKSYRAVARDFQVNSAAGQPDHKKVSRHADRCMSTSYQEVQKDGLTAQGKAIQARLRWLDEQVDTAVADALEGRVVMVGDVPMLTDDGQPLRQRSTSDLRVLLAAVREGRQNQALIAKLAGALPEQDDDALDHAREALKDPAVRRLLQQMEARLAEMDQAAGRDGIQA